MINFNIFLDLLGSLICSGVFCFVWYTGCFSRFPASREGSLLNKRPSLPLWGVWVSIVWVFLSIFFSWQLKQVSRSSRCCLTLRGLSICFLPTIIHPTVSYWFLITLFENVFILYFPLPKYFFVWDRFYIASACSYIFVRRYFKRRLKRPELDRVQLLYIRGLGPNEKSSEDFIK